jgi:hypothetical protein
VASLAGDPGVLALLSDGGLLIMAEDALLLPGERNGAGAIVI